MQKFVTDLRLVFIMTSWPNLTWLNVNN